MEVNEKNAEHLEKQVFNTGFGLEDKVEFRKAIAEGKPEMSRPFSKTFGNDEVTGTKNFRLSDKGNYFFNSFDLVLHKKDGLPVKQRFYVRTAEKVMIKAEGADPKEQWVNSTITLKEGYNMMKGRFALKNYVTREGEKYSSYARLDFKKMDRQGNYVIDKIKAYDLNSKLDALPIKERMTQKDRKLFDESVNRGNRQAATFTDKKKNEVIFFIESDPKRQDIKIFTSGNKRSYDWKEDMASAIKRQQAQKEQEALTEKKDPTLNKAEEKKKGKLQKMEEEKPKATKARRKARSVA